MVVNEMLLKELPFRPDSNQVFYIENRYDMEVNEFICSHYNDLKSMFRHIGMDFYYLPYLLRERDIEAKVRYYAPYLTTKILYSKVRSDAFVPYISDAATRETLKPSLLFEGRQEDYLGGVRFLTIALGDLLNGDGSILERLMHLIVSTREAFYMEEQERRLLDSRMYEAEGCSVPPKAQKSMLCSAPMPCFASADYAPCADEPSRIMTEDEIEEEQSLIETAKVLRELRMAVQKLRLEGVSLMAIHEFIDKQEPLSQMVITPDYRIFLPDYNNLEIEMGALPKAIYFLYLRYPEGIVCKCMPDYFSELLNIYKQLRPNTDEARLNLTITKVVNPLGNALNENIARIRKAFVEKFDEHLANNYIITGERGLQYSIPLDRNLITWEE